MSILNVARMGWFSSDRTIREYADDIWMCRWGGDALEPRRHNQHRHHART